MWIWRWMWSPYLSASSALSRKYSNSFSSATQCCSGLCFLPDGQHTSWLESKFGMTYVWTCFLTAIKRQSWQSWDTSSFQKSSNNRHIQCVLLIIQFALCTGLLGVCLFLFVANLCHYHNNVQMASVVSSHTVIAKVKMCTLYCLTYLKL